MAIRVITTNPTGGGYDITDLIDGLSWSSVNPGGDERASFTFKRSWFSENPEIAKGARVRIEDGLETLWTGRIEERSRGTNTTEEITVTCYGLGNRLKDNLMSMIYVDRDLSGWGAPSNPRRLALLGIGRHQTGAHAAETDVNTGLSALTLSIDGGGGVSRGAEAWYDAGEDNVVQSIYYSYQAYNDTNLFLGLGNGANDAITNETTGDLLGSATGSGTFTPANARRYAFVELFWNSGLPWGSDGINYYASFQRLAVFGNHGLTKRGSAGSQGFFDSDIVQHVISQIPNVDIRTIDEGSFVIQQAAYKDKVQPEQVINDAAQYENRDWGTWGSQDIFSTDTNGQFDYKFKDTTTRHWTVSRADAEDLDLADELSGLYDTVVVKYTDEAGVSRSVTRTATVQELVDAGMSPKTLELAGGTLTTAGAETLGDIALAFYGGFAPARGSLTLKGTASHYQRGQIPAHFMRADGSNIQIRDILPSTTALALDSTPDRRTTFPMKRVSVDCSGAVPSVTVDLDQSNDRLTQLQARTGITAQVTLG